jgi:cytochrome c
VQPALFLELDMTRLRSGSFLTALLTSSLVLFTGLLPAAARAQAPAESIEPLLAAAKPELGKTIFAQCAVCHVASAGAQATIGPNLWNVVGRPVASQTGYDYSDSLRRIGGNWDFEKLSVYLTDPKSLAPEGRMPFPGIKSINERANLIAYLRTLSDDPVALPASAAGASSVASSEDDPEKWQGLPAGSGREDVFYRCKACHSLMIVKQQGLDRDSWDELLVWMVDENGMPPIDDEATRNRVLDYLTTHYGRD